MNHCDVLIVGGGPAGSSLAWALRNSGLDIMLVDRSYFPRNKVCAGWITPKVLNALQIDINDYARHNIIQPVHGFRISLMGSEPVKIDYAGEPISYGIRRCEFDHYLLQRINAEIKQGFSIESIRPVGKEWLVNNDIRTALIIGAGGHFCPVARQINNGNKKEIEKIVAQEIEIECTDAELAACDIDRTIPELFFCEDLKGYGWIFPKGNVLNIGLGREDNRQLSHHVKKFSEYLLRHNKLPKNHALKFNGHAYQLYKQTPRHIIDDGMLLVGDAAGLAYSQSGEGICPAIESSLLAASVIEQAQGNYSREQLGSYPVLIERHFGKRQLYSKDNVITKQIKKYMANKLLKSKWFVRHIVLDKWFLHTNSKLLKI
jgi:flavin-dependent dehydrogenase